MKNRKTIAWIFLIASVLILILVYAGMNRQKATGSAEVTEDEVLLEKGSASGDYTSTVMYATDADGNESATMIVFAMDTQMTLTVYGEAQQAAKALEDAADVILRMDQLCSIGIADSEISKLNTNKTLEVSEDTLNMIRKALLVSEDTDGAFDMTVYPLMELWGFTTQQYQKPLQQQIDAVLETVGSDRVTVEEDTVFLEQETQIDLGGIAKGYTGDLVIEALQAAGIEKAVISLGGNVITLGTKDGELWQIAIQDPNDETDYLGVLATSGESVVTSGGYERYFEEDGQIYHHILDPATGYPADSGLTSVTVVSKDGMLADALSTSLYVMGLDRSIAYWEDHADEFDMILYTEDDKLYVTQPLDDRFDGALTPIVLSTENTKSQ